MNLQHSVPKTPPRARQGLVAPNRSQQLAARIDSSLEPRRWSVRWPDPLRNSLSWNEPQ